MDTDTLIFYSVGISRTIAWQESFYITENVTHPLSQKRSALNKLLGVSRKIPM